MSVEFCYRFATIRYFFTFELYIEAILAILNLKDYAKAFSKRTTSYGHFKLSSITEWL